MRRKEEHPHRYNREQSRIVETEEHEDGIMKNAKKLPPFRNEAFTDFSLPENQEAMRAAIAKVCSQLGREYPLIIGGEKVVTSAKIRSINPAQPSQVIGIFQKAGPEQVQPAMDAALRAYESWSRTSVEQRVRLVLDVAALIRKHRHEFSAWMLFEVAKNWVEADVDTAEALDFCEFYARQALRLAQAEPPLQWPGERDWFRYIPLGVGVVIPPWNFPGAIMVGMTMASIVCGNTVVLKPSSDAPGICRFFFDLLRKAGLPEGVVNFCPGAGDKFGEALVVHPQTRFVCFTGSRDVGLRIHSIAARPQPGQIWIKRSILEMGGKDAILVDEDADLDAAVEGVASSAFGFQGQKCSACSRLILHQAIYDAFLEKLKARVEKITVGDPVDNPGMAAVIHQRSMEAILQYIEQGKHDGRLITGGKRRSDLGEGYFIEPTIFADIEPGTKLEQEEIFGPVLAVIRARDFDHALQIANDTPYGLTGSIYARDEEKIAQGMREFHVGNLYINRKCTGAMVGAHPFGGFNLSGTDTKAGGPDYLLQFTQAQSIGRKL
jgi:1-pyrroline-5-carboxylate dehydrogenase